MRALRFESVGQPLRVAELTDPAPAADEVLLRVAACGICGSDLHMTEDPATFGIAAGDVLGHEIAGEVMACGLAVTDVHPGDRVAVSPLRGCGDCDSCRRGEPAWCAQMRLIGGGYAEFVTVAARQCRPLPADIPTTEGALAEPVAVALHAVLRAELKPGNRVLVLGAGPIGLLVALWARRLGARDVVVADLERYQEARAALLGATGFLISGPTVGNAFTDLTGAPPDIVFDCVGKRGLIDLACRAVRSHGTVVGVGLCVGGDTWDPFAALSKEIRIVFAVFFTMAEFDMAIAALGPARFRPQSLITHRVGFAETPAMFEAIRSRTTQCKVLIEAAA